MKIGTTPIIAENIAPSNASSLAIFDGDTKVCNIDISKMQQPILGEKLYSFGLVSDTHMGYNSYTDTTDANTVGLKTDDGNGLGRLPNGTKLRRALEYFDSQGVEFCCNAGDFTNIGFYREKESTELYPYQFQEYRDICALFPNIPMYGACGNHESYNANIENSVAELIKYTGHGIAHYVEKGTDVFIFVGQSVATHVMSVEHLNWLQQKLETFRNQRCFVFVHSYIEEDSGDAGDVRENSIFDYWGATKKGVFMELMRHYKNAILFHGHSHMKFENQSLDKFANYTTRNGFKSVHIPSSAIPRVADLETNVSVDDYYSSQGYLVDVYENHIILRGRDFVADKFLPIATYCLDTTLQTIAAGTFTDSTGTIETEEV